MKSHRFGRPKEPPQIKKRETKDGDCGRGGALAPLLRLQLLLLLLLLLLRPQTR